MDPNLGAPGTRPDNLTLEGHLAIDFVNTVDWRLSGNAQEFLKSYSDLIKWAVHAGALALNEARQLLREAAKSPKASRAALDKAIVLREAVFRALKALVDDDRIGQRDLQIIDEATHEALSNLRLAVKGRTLMWSWKKGANLNRVSWIIAKATAELLVDSQTLSLLRICGGAGCGWAFLDTSRNKSRRWCAMRVCGNRDKARRHYEKLRAADVVKS